MAITSTLSSPVRPIYDRTYQRLKRFSWPWRLLATYTSFMTWMISTPWLAVRSIAPQNLQDNLADAEFGFLNFVTPLINLIQDTAFKVFHIADVTVDWAINTASHIYHNNLKGIEHTFDHLLCNVEQRVRFLKDDGLNGIPKAISYDLRTPSGTNHKHMSTRMGPGAGHTPLASVPLDNLS